MGAVGPEVALAAVRSAIGATVGCARREPVPDAVTSAVTCVPGTVGVGDVEKPPIFVGGTVAGSVVFTGTVDAGAVVHVAIVGGTVASVGSAVGIPVAVGIEVGVALDTGVAVGVFVTVRVGVAVAVGTGSAAVVTGARTVTGSAAVAVAFPGKIEAIRDGSAGETNPTVKSAAQAMTPAAIRPLSMPLSSMGGRPGGGTAH